MFLIKDEFSRDVEQRLCIVEILVLGSTWMFFVIFSEMYSCTRGRRHKYFANHFVGVDHSIMPPFGRPSSCRTFEKTLSIIPALCGDMVKLSRIKLRPTLLYFDFATRSPVLHAGTNSVCHTRSLNISFENIGTSFPFLNESKAEQFIVRFDGL